MTKNLLIIGPNPICSSSSTKALLQYVHAFTSGDVFQFYSNTSEPPEMSCKSFFRITDSELLLSWLGRKKDYIGREFKDNVRKNEKADSSSSNGLFKKLYQIGKKGTPIIQLLRDLLWNEKKVINKVFAGWLENVCPSIVLLHSSNGIFLLKLGLLVARMFNAKLVFEIADDYYFNDHFSLSPFYFAYRRKYKRIFQNVVEASSHVFYISDKMKRRYDRYFHVDGTVIRPPFQLDFPIKHKNADAPKNICYFGNIGMGRFKTINRLGVALKDVAPGSKIHVYCPKIGHGTSKSIKHIRSLEIHEPVSFKELVDITGKADYLLFVESFEKRYIGEIRYSLSTKIGDCLNSGLPFLAIGPRDSGSMEYLIENDLGFHCADPSELNVFLRDALNPETPMDLEKCKDIARRDFSEETNEAIISGVYDDLLAF